MTIHLHPEIARRLQAIADAQRCTVSALVHRAVVSFVGLEAVPLGDEEVYGRERKEAVCER